jgi:hypothetical protein
VPTGTRKFGCRGNNSLIESTRNRQSIAQRKVRDHKSSEFMRGVHRARLDSGKRIGTSLRVRRFFYTHCTSTKWQEKARIMERTVVDIDSH